MLKRSAWFHIAVAAVVWGCAQGAASDDMSGVDPTLPSGESPAKGGATTKKNDAGSSETIPAASNDPGDDTSDPSDAGTSKPPAKDSGTTNPPPSNPPPSSTKPTQGEVLITEVMFDPSGAEPSSEWFELHNTASSTRLLSGLTIVDGGNRTHVIGSGVTLGAGGYLVLVRNKSVATTTLIPSVSSAYEYGAGQPDNAGIQLANGSTGSLELRDGSTVIAQAHYGGWFTSPGGASLQLRTLTYSASAQSSSWCVSSTAWTSGSDKGTPGAASDCL